MRREKNRTSPLILLQVPGALSFKLPVSIEATIQRAADGDQGAWDTLVRTCWRKVFNVAYRFVGTYDEAEDLAQDIFLKVFRSLGTFDQRANFQTWLISVSRNYCIDRYRSGRRARAVFAREVDASTVQAEAPGLSAYARVERQDRIALLREALRALSPTLRAAVLLRDIHELSYQEIADRLGVAEGTVKSRINRGRAELARQIELRRAGLSEAGASQ
ncbi:MAG: RNA polymerase sigma factor [Acidobacteria bacterium]|nr:RNA polymerase sigma factor [Acidobacteriota bacterium]